MALKEEGSSANENCSFLDGSSVRRREMRVSVGRLAFMEGHRIYRPVQMIILTLPAGQYLYKLSSPCTAKLPKRNISKLNFLHLAIFLLLNHAEKSTNGVCKFARQT